MDPDQTAPRGGQSNQGLIFCNKGGLSIYAEKSQFFLQFREGALGPFRLGKLAGKTPKLKILLSCTIMAFSVIFKT